MSSEMVSVKAIAERWGISSRRVGQMCNAGEIDGAIKVGGQWKLPANVAKPQTLRKRNHMKTEKLLPCPIGITSYKEVSSECYYVDKTLLIKDIIDDHSKVTLFTRPRRFGKTLTMDMVKTYFEKTEEDTSVYFSNRAIWSCDESYKACQGAYPVIFLSFKDAHQNTWKEMYECLSMSLRNEYKRHMNVLDSTDVSNIDKDFFNRMLNNEVSEVECQASLGQLSYILSKAYNTRVIVIIDEYDTPIQQGYSNGYYSEAVDFMRNLFSGALKDNEALEFGLLTGILRVAKESLFSGLNNLTVNTILDEKYSEYFGFTEEETCKMLDYYKKSDKTGELKEWYDGYLFGKTEIYNPWSVICYINNQCVPKAFWSRTSSNDIILDVIRGGSLEMQEALLRLWQDKPVQTLVDTDIIYPEIGFSDDTVYSFLLMTGYLKISRVVGRLDDTPICNLLIPNKEIKGVFKRKILDNLSKNLNGSVIRNFQIALKTNNIEGLQGTIRQYLLQAASCFDTAGENFYHGMMLGLLAIMSEDYIITSNRESGEGRFDIQLNPIANNYPGILMEFKASDNPDEDALAKLAEDAIQQIIDKKYITEMKWKNVLEIQLYGIAFSGKRATIKMMEIE